MSPTTPPAPDPLDPDVTATSPTPGTPAAERTAAPSRRVADGATAVDGAVDVDGGVDVEGAIDAGDAIDADRAVGAQGAIDVAGAVDVNGAIDANHVVDTIDADPAESADPACPDGADSVGSSDSPAKRAGPDEALLARLGRMGVQLGAAGIASQAPTRTDVRAGEGGKTVRARQGGSSEAVDALLDSPGSAADGANGGRRGPASSGTTAEPRDGTTPALGTRSAPVGVNALPIEEAVPGRDEQNNYGRCYVSVVRRAEGEEHAGEPVGAALAACTSSLAELAGDARLADMDVSRAAFVDTETTGLSGAAGTYAFLIGAGRFRDGAFHVKQFFMRHPGEEAAQLEALSDWVDGCDGLVTFNGKAFDAPLLATRYVMNGQPNPLADVRHLDLLPASRRLWRRRLPDCRLVSLESHVLGLDRVDDVPGWLVPERYLRYQRDGDARPLEGIFRHNALDILAMVSLVSRLARSWAEPDEALAHARDWLSLARAYERAGRLDRAMSACQAALGAGLARPDEVDEAFERLSLSARRQGEWERAVEIWESLVRSERPRRLFPFEELAKFHEHRAPQRDLVAALALTERGHALVEAKVIRPRRGRRKALEELEHRMARLRRRVAAG